jgi:hypothetical protein
MRLTRPHSWSMAFLAVCTWPTVGEAQPVPEGVARELGQRLATHVDRIKTLQFHFRTSVKYLVHPDESVNWQDFEYRDAFYACDAAAGSQYLSCIDTQYGRNLRKRVLQLPSGSRMLYEHQGEKPFTEGFVNKEFSSAWEVFGPQVFLRISVLKVLRSNLDAQNYLVHYSDGPGSDPVILVGFGPDPVQEPPQKGLELRIKLDASREFTPYELQDYVNGNRTRVISLELFQAAPGIWLPQRGLAKGWALKKPHTEFYEAEFRMDTASVRVNEPIAPSVFDVRFPEGTRVNDQIHNTVYTQGLKPGQATQRSVVANAEHARHIAPAGTKQEPEKDRTPAGTVHANYGTPWYGRIWFWTLTGSALAVAVAGFLFYARRG